MRTAHTLLLLIAFVWLLPERPAGAQVSLTPPAQVDARIRLRVTTEFGVIDVDLDPTRAPGTVANFLKYVDGGFFDDGQFHRSARLETQVDRAVKIEVVQASVNRGRLKEEFPPIPLERTSTTSLLHKDGSISMARGGADTARSSFFICVGDQPSLDFGGARNADGQGFAAFGHVVAGMDVVRRIHQAPATGETLDPPIRILKIARVDSR
jgi:peptidyl-prolyl cis-trans isomerase A (cyclophilin A)